MSIHTPAPWRHRRMKTHYVIEASNGARVAEVRHIGRPDGSTSEREAVAIAMYPEVLQALIDLLEQVRPAWSPTIERAQAVAAKATAETIPTPSQGTEP